MNGINVLIKETPWSSQTPSAVCKLEKDPHQNPTMLAL